jgi:hydroxypyruvate reductase
MAGPFSPREVLDRLLQAALAAADPARCVPPALPPPPRGRTVVVGAGKAAAAMALAVERNWQGPLAGLVVTRYGHGLATRRIEVVEAAHPVPDAAGQRAAGRILAMMQGLTADDLVLCLLSGGGSALLALPAAGVTLDDKRAVTAALLRSGAAIDHINCVRKHLSAIKGGRLAAAAAPARVVTLAISDVPGDHPSVIASGPTVADPTTLAEARAVLARYGIDPPPAVVRALAEGCETPKQLSGGRYELVATPWQAMDAAAAEAVACGYRPVLLGDAIEGEAREAARVMAGIARSVVHRGQPAAPPAVLLSGGELTVTLRGGGRGGPNTEFLLALALALKGMPGVHAMACDTDGIDGSEDNAGAVIGPDTLLRGQDAAARLDDNDAYGYFAALGELVVTGPTRTNVNDFRAILIE